MQQAKQYLDALIIKYDEPYLFHALGDYYVLMEDDEIAYTYYNKALERTSNDNEKSVIAKKIIETNK